MANKLQNEFVPTLRLPIISSGRAGLYVSCFPGEDDTLRVVLPGRRFLPLGLFRLALDKARYNEIVDRGRVRIAPERKGDLVALHVEIDPKDDDEDGDTFLVTLTTTMVKEIAAAFRLAEVVQDHYDHYAQYLPADDSKPAVRQSSQDGALFLNDQDEEAATAA